MCTGEHATFPEEARYKHMYKVLCCATCGIEERLHEAGCKHHDFSKFRCVNCNMLLSSEDEECNCDSGRPDIYKRDTTMGVMNIPTPFLDQVLDHQFGRLPDYKSYLGIYYWFFVVGGYFLMNKKDNGWSMIPTIFGEAGTGKSMYLTALMKLVPTEKLGTLSSNAQETFGLEALVNHDGTLQKKYCIFECTGDFKIPPQQFQSMASGS